MAGAVLWRWVILRLLREPAVGVLWLLLLLWMPLVLGLRPLATPDDAVALTRAWCYPAGLIGVLLLVQPVLVGLPHVEQRAGDGRAVGGKQAA